MRSPNRGRGAVNTKPSNFQVFAFRILHCLSTPGIRVNSSEVTMHSNDIIAIRDRRHVRGRVNVLAVRTA